ncbi:hypothetical protein [Actinosynnema sp. NPDC020468]|uniref:hypothetical protein n=1 Tax=Actinosynnema sp. NPDC020468 TaxID=3154488 RepID=UPI0033F88E2C
MPDRARVSTGEADGPLPRWAVVDGVVVAHLPHGLRVRVPSGEIGVVDRVLISDLVVGASEWPAVGSTLTVVGAGCTTGGQSRLSARRSDVETAPERRSR